MVLESRIDPVTPPAEPKEAPAYWKLIAELEARVDKLTFAVSDGIERVSRAENRIQKTVTSARRLVREAGLEHAGIEAESEELQPPDGEGVEPLPPVPAEVGEARTIQIPGGTLSIGSIGVA